MDFFFVADPLMSPTACVLCMRHQDPAGFVDVGRDLHPHGHLYVCATCAVQMGARFGMLAADDAATLAEALAERTAELMEAKRQLESASDRVLVSRRGLEDIVREAVKT